MRRTTRVTAPLAVAALVCGLVACSNRPGPQAAVTGFLNGWKSGQFGASDHLISASGASTASDKVAGEIKSLAGDLAASKPTLTAGRAKIEKDDASVPISVSWPIVTGVTWKYQTELRLHFNDGKWNPIFEPSVIAPDLADGDKLTVKSTAPNRGSILDGAGAPLFSRQEVINVGVEPDKIKNQTALINALNAAFRTVPGGVDLTDLPNQIKAAQPTAFIPIVTLRKPIYDQIRSQIHDLDGTVFTDDTKELGPSSTFARCWARSARSPRNAWTRTRANTSSATRSASAACPRRTTTGCAAAAACRW
jgi:hypothetical protein